MESFSDFLPYGKDLNWSSPWYKSEALLLKPTCSELLVSKDT